MFRRNGSRNRDGSKEEVKDRAEEFGERGEDALDGGCVDEAGVDVYERNAGVADGELLEAKNDEGKGKLRCVLCVRGTELTHLKGKIRVRSRVGHSLHRLPSALLLEVQIIQILLFQHLRTLSSS
jgi:hypothetical protein